MTPQRLLLAVLCAVSLIAAACGSDSSNVITDEANASSEPAAVDADADVEATDDAGAMDDGDADVMGDFPVTIESAGGTWTLESAPQRIISLSPTATEILFAIGAGDQVVAVDAYSYYPAEAPVTDLSGFEPNVEAVLSYDPDLVVIANDANDLVASLTAVDVPVLVSAAPADIEGGYATMAELGVASGHVDNTAAVIGDLREEITEAFDAAPVAEMRIYHELGESLYSASSFGFVGSVYAEMGASNIADAADADETGFPQLTEEAIVAADPELIVITDQGGYTADDVAARPGWGEVAAVENGNIVTVNADIASRWGPRLPQFIKAVADALAAMQVSS